jgi:oligopeptide/dipeptide ABC transporter ATP-binding protein
MSTTARTEIQTEPVKPLIRVEHLKQHFPITRGVVFSRNVGSVKAVDDVSFHIDAGETLGLVGESGCGKSTTGRSILRLYTPSSGSVYLDDVDIAGMSESELREVRPRMQMIFQDSYASLNPRHSVGKIIAEPMVIRGTYTVSRIRDRVAELIELVGLKTYHLKRFPHEFSGGQRQRIGIARALALNPRFIVCDEPISALDVSIQAQVINLLLDLQKELGLTYLFIAHDLSMVRHVSNRIAVMYLGRLMELAEWDVLFARPLHPYTQSLMSAVPVPNPAIERNRDRIILSGDVPSAARQPTGCVFHTRCRFAGAVCGVETPEFREVEPGHYTKCHFVGSAELGKEIEASGRKVVDAARAADEAVSENGGA